MKQNKYKFKEIYKNAPKLGSGYSRILGALSDMNDINKLTIEESFSKTEDSNIIMPSVDISQNTNHISGMMRHHRRNNSITSRPMQKVLPKVNLSESVSILPSIRSTLNKMSNNEARIRNKIKRNYVVDNRSTKRYSSKDPEY